MIGTDGKTAYNRRWSRDYNGASCMFGELIDATLPARRVFPKPDPSGSLACTLERTLRPVRLFLGMQVESSRSGL